MSTDFEVYKYLSVAYLPCGLTCPFKEKGWPCGPNFSWGKHHCWDQMLALSEHLASVTNVFSKSHLEKGVFVLSPEDDYFSMKEPCTTTFRLKASLIGTKLPAVLRTPIAQIEQGIVAAVFNLPPNYRRFAVDQVPGDIHLSFFPPSVYCHRT
jgi:hypothetical protein